MRVDENSWHNMLELLLLEHWYDKDTAVVCAYDLGGRVAVLKNDTGCHFLVGVEEAEVGRVVK